MKGSHRERYSFDPFVSLVWKVRDRRVTRESVSYTMPFWAKRPQPGPFQYLERYTDFELHTSQSRTIPQLLDTISERARERKQVLLINGPLGVGKTRTRKTVRKELVKPERLVEGEIKYVTAEKALRAAVPRGKSGFYTKEDYQMGTDKLEENIRRAIDDPKIRCIIIECPATGGYDVKGDGNLLGMNRGTSALLHLFGPKGEFRHADVDTYAIGIARQDMFDAYKKRFDVELGRRSRRGEGGSYLGMFAADQDLHRMLKQNHYAFARTLGIPRVVVNDYYFYQEQMIAGLLNWFYRDYLQLPKENVLLCSNEK